jgi:hypothetical protein
MVICVMPLSHIVGIGVSQEGFGAQLLDTANDVMHKEGLHIVGVTQLTHM